ncbi:hypothetical protein [Mesorhizobium sp. ANAO-SY3R2]|uniref:hypothetical protein n=1 Tax=Mesorhizobium sp. ANAO-SY3R2 TaxID=3166644 RepID=UPI00366E378B
MAKKARVSGPVGGDWIPATCSKADLAVLLGISTRAITDWDQKGVLVRATARGRYQTTPSIHGYLKALRDQAGGRASSTGKSLADERAETEKVGREIQKLKLAQMKGEVMTLAEIDASWSAFASAVKQMVLTIPGKARSTIPHLTAHDAEVLKKMCRDMLMDLAEEVETVVISGDPKAITDDD